MKRIVFMLVLFLLTVFSASARVVSLEGCVRPRAVAVDDTRLYVAEKTEVLVYSLEDFSLLHRFGKEGEGPREFRKKIIMLEVRGEHVLVNSVGRYSVFKKDGTFVKELKPGSFTDMRFRPFGDGFVGGRMLGEEGVLYWAVNLYDKNLKRVKELYRRKREVQMGGKGTRVYGGPLPARVCGEYLLVAPDNEGKPAVEVWDGAGKKVRTITHDSGRLKLTEGDRQKVMDHLKSDPEIKMYLEAIKPIRFPTYFPPLRTYFAADNRVYGVTFLQKEGKNECLVWDLRGKFLKRLYIPFRLVTPVDHYPAAVGGGKLYQVVEREETEGWELHISRLN